MRKLAIILVLYSITVQAQVKSDHGDFKLSQISFIGSQKYSQKDLLTLSGLQPGVTANAQLLKDAADHLAASGAFDEVRYRFNGNSVEFQLTENQELVPCVFDNFVWYEDAELQDRIRKRVPLYTGFIPNRGDLSEKITTALEQILAEKGVAAKVSALPDAQLNGSVTAIVFAVSAPEVKIRQIQFVGASSSELPNLQAAAKPLMGNDFRITFASNYLKSNLLPLYQRDGFLHASFQNPTAVLASSSTSIVTVDLSVKVFEGEKYRVDGIHWAGTDILSQKDATPLILLKTGDVANQDLLRKSLSNIGATYASKGYLNARIKANPTLDEERKSVSYEVLVTPGDLYHMGRLDVANLDATRAGKVRQSWRLKQGDIYDPVYVREFLHRDKEALSSLDGWSAAFKQTINDETKLVDVVLIFQKGGPLK